jgi:hypothetical protein
MRAAACKRSSADAGLGKDEYANSGVMRDTSRLIAGDQIHPNTLDAPASYVIDGRLSQFCSGEKWIVGAFWPFAGSLFPGMAKGSPYASTIVTFHES